MITNILKNPWLWVVLVFCGMAFFIYTQNKKIKELEFQGTVSNQNASALQDSLSKMADSLQTTAVFVKDLNNKYTEAKNEVYIWKNKYVIISSKYILSIDSIHILNTGLATLKNDTTLLVEFKGKQSIAKYDGFVETNLRTKKYDSDFYILFDSIKAGSDIFFDKEDNLWKNRTYSKTPGMKIIGLSTLDEKTLREIRGTPDAEKINKYFGIGGILMPNQLHGGIVVKPSDWMFGINYKFFDKNVSDELWYNKLSVSIHYFPF